MSKTLEERLIEANVYSIDLRDSTHVTLFLWQKPKTIEDQVRGSSIEGALCAIEKARAVARKR